MGRENLSGSGEGVTHYRTSLAAFMRRSGGAEPACLTDRSSPEAGARGDASAATGAFAPGRHSMRIAG
jgi:hypothetical protein